MKSGRKYSSILRITNCAKSAMISFLKKNKISNMGSQNQKQSGSLETLTPFCDPTSKEEEKKEYLNSV